MNDFDKHCILDNASVKDSLNLLNELAEDSVLFVTNEKLQLLGALTDGDLRRGFLNGLSFDDALNKFYNHNPFAINYEQNIEDFVDELRKRKIKIVPLINGKNIVVDVFNLTKYDQTIPVDAVIMAGGKGLRLRPLTTNTPKPLLKLGDKRIIDYVIDRCVNYNIKNFWISIGYLGSQIQEYLGDGKERGLRFNYVSEDVPLGTIGAVSKIFNFENENILVVNGDILSSINYFDFYEFFEKNRSDCAIATIPYRKEIPYAVFETKFKRIIGLVEKPTYTYYSNGGIYLIKRKLLEWIPKDKAYQTTDLINDFISKGLNVSSYPLHSYWSDLGNIGSYKRAQEEINNLEIK